jgi:cytoskeletal protein CcmA (bactofilin family)
MAGKDSFNNSTIGEGSVFEGKFYINGSLRIDGKFEGEIKTDEELVIGETGKVKTNINAKTVIIAGTVIGNITAEKEITLLETAKVAGDITTPALIISRGVITQGNVTITGGQKTNIRKLIDDSYGDKLVKEEKESRK